MIYADLHIHSNFSDGSSTVEEIIAMARAKGLGAISLVDHDTIDTYAYIKTLGPIEGLKIISGIEISAYDYTRGRKVHILGYNYKTTDNIQGLTDKTLEARDSRSRTQLRNIQESGYIIDESDIDPSVNSKKTLYRQQIVYAMAQSPYDSQAYQDLYKKLFKNGGPADIGDIAYPPAEDAIEAIVADGGIPVLAHPGELDSFDLVEDLVELGLGGIEVYHPSHSLDHEMRALDLCQSYGLLATGGSDYHGDYYRIRDLACLEFPQDILQTLGI